MGTRRKDFAKVTPKELEAIRAYSKSRSNDLDFAQRATYDLLENYRKGEGKKRIRFVMSRAGVSESPVKDVESVVKKILRKRQSLIDKGKDPKTYGLENIDDWIGVKVLCPYPTDVTEVIKWVLSSGRFSDVISGNPELLSGVQQEKEFAAKPLAEQIKEAARRERELRKQDRGYLAWHFLVRTHAYSQIPCELQIKTLVEEAWDAKTHDVSYKKLGIKEELKSQMKLLSRSLEVADDQSETVKTLIEEEETHRQRRRTAAIQQYLSSLRTKVYKAEPELKTIWQKFDPGAPLNVEAVTEIGHLLQGRPLTVGLCHSRVLLAILTDRVDLEISAFDCVNSFVAAQQPSEDKNQYGEALRIRAITRWALGETGKALEDIEEALILKVHDADLNERLKTLYSYYVADAEDNDRKEKAFQYVEEDSDSARARDTKGLLLVVFGDTIDEVNLGRRYLLEAIEEARKSPTYSGDPLRLAYAEAFHKLHDYIAVRRLLEFYHQ